MPETEHPVAARHGDRAQAGGDQSGRDHGLHRLGVCAQREQNRHRQRNFTCRFNGVLQAQDTQRTDWRKVVATIDQADGLTVP